MNTKATDYINNNSKPLSDKEMETEVQKYQSFIQLKLLPQLESALSRQSELTTFCDEHIKLKATIEAIQISKQKTLKTKIDLGCGVFAQANIPDTRYIYVSVGHGFQLQLTLLEAMNYIDKRLELIKKQIKDSSLEVAKIRSHINAVEDGLVELVKA